MNRLSLAIVALVLASSCPIKITLPVPPIPSPVPSASPSVVPTPSPEPSPVATPSPEPTPTPEPSQKPPSPPPVKACIQSIPGPVPPGAIWKNGCPKGYDEVPGYKACIAHSSCEHPDSSGQCWDIPGYDVNSPDLQYGCFSCLSLTYYNLSSGYRALDAFGFLGVGPKYKPNPGKPIPGPQDALCRVKQDDGSWKDKDNVCPPCIGTPEPQPSPVATPVPSPGYSDVNKLLILNFGKCVLGKPFYFPLNSGCKELLITATPKSAEVCDGKACDATSHGRNLVWSVGRSLSRDDAVLDLGCATIAPGPTELTFNRTIVATSECHFDLTATLTAPDGKVFTATASVVAQ